MTATEAPPSEAPPKKKRWWRRGADAPRSEHMTLFEHLGELRKRAFICLGAVLVTGTIVFLFFDQVLEFLDGPYKAVTKGQNLVFTGVTEAFLVRFQLATYGGIILASPVIIYQFWRFVTPGLNPREKRFAYPLVISTAVLFALGVVVMWFTLEPAVGFLINQSDQLTAFITAKSYLTLVVVMALAFGLSFEFPVVLIFLLLARIVTTKQLRSARRYAIVGIVIFAAVITPSQDPYSLFFMAVPMYVFYESAIVIGRVLKR